MEPKKSSLKKSDTYTIYVNEISKDPSLNIKTNQKKKNLVYEGAIFNEKDNQHKTKEEPFIHLIATSENLLKEQKDVLINCDKISRDLIGGEFEIDKMTVLQGKENFPNFVNTYSKNLKNVYQKMKTNSEDIENAKTLQQENNLLKQKIDMMKIDKSDEYLRIESQINSMTKAFANEINSMSNFFEEINLKDFSIEKVDSENLTDIQIMNFFVLLKRLMKEMKKKIIIQDETIRNLSKTNRKFKEENRTNMQKKTNEFSDNNSKNRMINTSNMENDNNIQSYYSCYRNERGNNTMYSGLYNDQRENLDQNEMNNLELENYMINKYIEPNFYPINYNYNYMENSQMGMNNFSDLGNNRDWLSQSKFNSNN